MRLKCDCETHCLKANLAKDGSNVATATISASVGAGGVNRAADVRTVQDLLNNVNPARGGPVPLLVVDGLCGPKTNAAIRNFQTKQQLPVVDGRADPDGPTMQALNSERTNQQVSADRKQREATRLATAISTIPDAQSAVQRAIGLVEAAINFVLVGPGLTTSDEPFKFVNKHFKFDGLSRDHTLADLSIIKTTYRRMATVLRGRMGQTKTEIFGASMFAVDPLPGTSPPQAKAYVPKEDDETLKTSLIYWTDSIDGHPRDRFTYLTLHELGHFVDEEDPTLEIVDHGYAFFGTVLALNHDKRMHNADNYAMMAFERSFGRARLVSLYPLLAPMP
jgi:hypothetical protein